MHKTLRVGITGGIGSGKSTVCRIFSTLNIPIYYADDRAKVLMATLPDLRNYILSLLGHNAFFPDGQLNRKYIADIIFHDKEKFNLLNTQVHAAVFKDGQAWEHEHNKADLPYTLKEAAVMIESGSYKFLDKLIVVTAPIDTRIARVTARDQADRDAVMARIHNQLSDDERIGLADFTIINDGEHALIPQVMNIHHKLIALANS